MYYLNQNPFVRILIPFIAGILLSQWFVSSIVVHFIFFCSFVGMGFFILKNHQLNNFQLRWVPGIFIVLFFLSAGILHQNYSESNQKGVLPQTEDQLNQYIVDIVNDVEIKKNSVKTTAYCSGMILHDSLIPCSAKILLYFAKDSMSESLHYGDRLIIQSRFDVPDSALNPYAFNYNEYLASMGIYRTAWVQNGNWSLLQTNCGNPLMAFAIKLRHTVLDILEENLGNNEEYQVASALVTGYRAELDADLRQTFANAGAMHVMCVSGLHVGIIFLILGWIFSFLSDKKQLQRILKVILIVLCIWFYAMITGFSASVMRAATMFSFVAIGMLFERKIPIYNSLAASALLLLCINPMFLYQAGFQLSYLAVIGIVAFFPLIKPLIPAKQKIIIRIRDLVAVSIAAQIATTPISLYYFNQFPNYFILSNIIAVPMAGIIIYTALPALILSWIPVVGEFIGTILGLQIQFLNFAIRTIEQLPGSISENLYVSGIQMLILYSGIFLFYQAVTSKRRLLMYPAGLAFFTYFIFGTVHIFANFSKREVIIPHLQSTSIIITEGNTCTVLTKDTSDIFQKQFQTTYKKYASIHHIDEINFISYDSTYQSNTVFYSRPFLQVHDQRFALWDGKWSVLDTTSCLASSYILIADNPFFDQQRIAQTFCSGKPVFSASNSKYKVLLWEKIWNHSLPNYINIQKTGAFIIPLE